MTDQPKHTRRNVILGLAAAGFAAATIPPAIAARRPIGLRTVALKNIHTGEHLNTVYWADGKYVPDAMKRINWVLRDHHTDEVRRISPDLLDLLTKLQAKLRTREPFQVVSAYRSPATNAMLAAMTDGVASAFPIARSSRCSMPRSAWRRAVSGSIRARISSMSMSGASATGSAHRL